MKNILENKILRCLVCILSSFFISDCSPFEKPLRESDPSTSKTVQKTVEINTFSHVFSQSFNFELIPTMIEISNGILYGADGDPAHLVSWDLKNSNQAAAWVKLTDFQGPDAVSYDLNEGKRQINKRGSAPDGVLVALTNAGPGASANKKLGGVARFDRQLPKASWSRVFSNDKADQDWSSKIYDLQEMKNSDGSLVSYAIVEFSPPATTPSRYVLWAKNPATTASFRGFDAAGLASLKFSIAPPSPLPSNNKIGAFSMLPDGRIVLAQPKGLLSIKAESVGVADNENPRLEQKLSSEVLDIAHAEQWHAGLALGTIVDAIVAMRLVGGRYLVIMATDGAGNHSVKSADISQKSWVFSGNLKEPISRGSKIVVNGDEARIVSMEKIYSFKDGKFALELDSKRLSSNEAYIQQAGATISDPNPLRFNIDTFKGGNAGDIPDDGTHFFDAAPHQSDWFYATDRGLFRVTKSKLTKNFREEI